MLLKSQSSNEKNINEKDIEDVLRIFNLNGDDNKITKDEFVNGFIKWLDQTKLALNKQYISRKSLKEIYQVRTNTIYDYEYVTSPTLRRLLSVKHLIKPGVLQPQELAFVV